MMNSYTEHPITRSALAAAGWSPERHVDTNIWHDQLIADGYQWMECVQEFLASFGGLSIRPIQTSETVFGSGLFVIDPSLTIGERERIQMREDIVGEALCPIGEWEGESMVLFSSRGCVYSETTYQVLLLGSTPQQALDVIIRAHRYPELIEGKVWWNE